MYHNNNNLNYFKLHNAMKSKTQNILKHWQVFQEEMRKEGFNISDDSSLTITNETYKNLSMKLV